jgi:lactate dehydrogenase-like 2-hydroxyacid dehydrogenase
MKPAVLLPGSLPPDLVARLDVVFELEQGTAPQDAARVRGIATRSMVGADAALIARLPALEIISVFGVGCDAVDLEAARARGIIVTNTPDVLTEDTADYAIALMLSLARRVVEGDRFVRAGRWRSGGLPNSARVHGKKLGIAGLGRIGSAVAARARGFAMDIHWHGPRPKPGLDFTYHARLVDLARAVDFLILTCPGGAATDRMIDAEILEELGPTGFLINISRGSVVDEPALVAALRDGRIAGAALDVFADEPNVPAALLAMENVILEPHIASTTVETRRAIGDLVLANLKAHFAGKPALTPVG